MNSYINTAVKKPVAISYIHYTSHLQDSHILAWTYGSSTPAWIGNEVRNCSEEFPDGFDYPVLYIKTLEGNMRVEEGDYIIRGIKGEFYPCKPDIFLESYDLSSAVCAKLYLPKVTLIAMATRSEEEVHATIKALEYSCRDIQWGAVKLVSHFKPENLPSYIEHCITDQAKDIDDWSRKAIYELPHYVDTEFCLLVHRDGFVVNSLSWRHEFLNFDYIGAPWPLPQDDFSFRDVNGVIQRVGNSVSLRSKKLLDLANKLNLEWKPFHGFWNEDGFICVNNRHIYEEHGCKFAPLDVAKHFSHESPIPEVRGIIPFAFHKWEGANSNYPKF